MSEKKDYQPMQPHAWTATGMRPSAALFGSSLWVRESEAREAIEVARKAARPEALASAWVATSDKGSVLHFSKADGWQIEVVQTTPL